MGSKKFDNRSSNKNFMCKNGFKYEIFWSKNAWILFKSLNTLSEMLKTKTKPRKKLQEVITSQSIQNLC